MRPLGATIGVFVALVLTCPASAPAAEHVYPADRAATHAYLLAQYRYTQALVADGPGRVAAVEAVGRRIGGECPGVLAAQPVSAESGLPFPPQRGLGPRKQGESKRQRRQLGYLRNELAQTLAEAQSSTYRPALLAFAASIKELSWSERALTELVRSRASALESRFQAVPPPVCTDMSAWVESGYRTLSSTTRALVEEQEAAGTQSSVRAPSADPLLFLKASEGPAEKALARKTIALLRSLLPTSRRIAAVKERLNATLGLSSLARSERRGFAGIRERKQRPVRIASGRTVAGTRYSVQVAREAAGVGTGCKFQVEIVTANGSSSECSRASARGTQPNVGCDEGRLTIQARTLPATQTVRLLLSDGRRIDTRPVRIPKRLGGPAGVYYQEVRGPSPIPVDLIELDAGERKLRELKLELFHGCSSHPFTYLPGGVLDLVRASAPRGPSFTIVAERFRAYGRVRFELSLAISDETGVRNAEEKYTGGFPAGALELQHQLTEPKKVLQLEIQNGCHPYEYAVAYGLLRDPSDRALIRVEGRLQSLKRVAIPARFHAGGVLVYAALGSVPEEWIVRSPAGRTLKRVDLRGEAREARETCEGEDEGAGPNLGGDEEISKIFGE